MTPRVTGGLLPIVALPLGAAAGALGFGIYQVRAGRWSPNRAARSQELVLQRLTKDLGLNPGRRQQAEAILQETGAEFARLREEIRPRFREIQERSRARITAVLDPGQRAKFDVLADEWQRRAERRRGETQGTRGREPGRP